MQINSASSHTQQSNGSLAVGTNNQVTEQRDYFRVQQTQQSSQQAQQSAQKSAQQTQQQNEPTKQVERFDVDEQALAIVEQAQFDSQKASNNQNSTNTQGNSQASYDSSSQLNQTAVAAYSSVGQMAQRENIQQVFGVDLYA